MAAPPNVIERTGTLPASAEEALAWHARPGALGRLTPPWERTEVAARVQYHLEAAGPEASRYTLVAAAGRGLARSRAERLMAYRQATLREDLAAHARFRDRGALQVAVTGASGLLGSALVPFLSTGGHRVIPVSRRPKSADGIRWDPLSGVSDASSFEGLDALVHLAGENIGARWTRERKRRIRESRIAGTRQLAEALARLKRPPSVLVAASAMGIYGDRRDEILTEGSVPPGPPADFLVEVGREWEAATDPAREAGIRVVHLRLGLVLTPSGGALGRMLPAFRLGVGGPLGNGRQWVSWISIDDAIGAMHHALLTPSLSEPVNTAAPAPVTSRDFAATLGRVLRRPALLPVPATALRLLFGEMADTALLGSQRLSPARLLASGYSFRHPRLEEALRHVLGRPW